MRPVLPGDLAAAGCALLALPASRRAQACEAMIRRAGHADQHRLATGRAHPRWGNGSLAGVAMRMARCDEPCVDDPDYLDCLLVVLTGLKAAQRDRAFAD